mmetsp:Transcript_18298/g.42605  ORF Transcript_18298/g.42605 Transcript_18298/m.42605 type:complete len:339 (-) Transcript_18298:15-1031(-)
MMQRHQRLNVVGAQRVCPVDVSSHRCGVEAAAQRFDARPLHAKAIGADAKLAHAREILVESIPRICRNPTLPPVCNCARAVCVLEVLLKFVPVCVIEPTLHLVGCRRRAPRKVGRKNQRLRSHDHLEKICAQRARAPGPRRSRSNRQPRDQQDERVACGQPAKDACGLGMLASVTRCDACARDAKARSRAQPGEDHDEEVVHPEREAQHHQPRPPAPAVVHHHTRQRVRWRECTGEQTPEHERTRHAQRANEPRDANGPRDAPERPALAPRRQAVAGRPGGARGHSRQASPAPAILGRVARQLDEATPRRGGGGRPHMGGRGGRSSPCDLPMPLSVRV